MKILTNKQYKKFKELEQLKESYKEQNKELKIEIKNWKNYNIEEYLLSEKTRYAIIVNDNFEVKLFNNGKLDNQIREIRFEIKPGYLPELEIRK